MRVLIAGAGIAGLATAVSLRKNGYEPVVIEQAEAFGLVGKGINMGVSAVRCLRWLGALDPIEEHSARSTAISVHALDDGRELRRVELGELALERYGDVFYSVHRADLLDGLLSQFSDGNVHLGSVIAGVEERPDEVTVVLANGDRISGDVLVGADGVNSAVRESVFGPSEATFTNLVAWRSTVPQDAVPLMKEKQQIMTYTGEGMWMVMYPIGHGLASATALVPADEETRESWTMKGDVDVLRRMFAGSDPAVLGVIEAFQDVLLTGIYTRLPLRKWATARTVLIGDAAHAMGPFLGNAGGCALEDAVTFGIVLGRHGPDSVSAALREFEQRRVSRASRFVTTSLALGYALAERDPARAAARNGRLRGIAQLDPQGVTDWEWLFGFDVPDAAHQPLEALGAEVFNPLRRPEARRAFEGWRDALHDKHRVRSWVGEREGYEQFLTASMPPPDGLVVQERSLGDVPVLHVEAAGASADRIVLHLHGGGFVYGSAASSIEVAGRISQAWNCAVVVPDYRLAPEHPYPAALQDVVSAYEALVAAGKPVVVSGECAGGGLALALALSVRDAPTPDPCALVLVSPFCDLSLSGASIDENENSDPWINRMTATQFAGSYIQDANIADPLLSPLRGDLAGLPPMLVAAATGEGLRDDATRLVAAASDAGVDARLELVEDSVHSFVLFPFLPESERLLEQARGLVVTATAKKLSQA